VLLFHLERPADARPFLPQGWVGVDLFFVLSGFLITGLLLDGKGEPGQLKHFYARRVLRIFPLYYTVLAIVFLGMPALAREGAEAYPASHAPAYLLYVQNLVLPLIEPGGGVPVTLSHTWSLAIEEQFYLVWPWLVLLLPRRWLAGLLVLVLVAAPLARHSVLSETPRHWYAYWFVYKNTLLHVDGLAAGSLLAIAARGLSERALRAGSLALALTALPATLWLLHALTRGGVLHYPYEATSPLVGSALFTGLALGFAGVLGVALTVRSRPLDVALTNRPAVWLGRVSYGVYVFHFPVFLALRSRGLHPLVPVAATLLVAALSWRFLEQPFLRLKARFPSAADARPADS
jgi:peptidoglycan/LPS O-acetylase OafA/YrhL